MLDNTEILIKNTNPFNLSKGTSLGSWRNKWQGGSGLGIAAGAASMLSSAYMAANPDIDSVNDKVDLEIDAMKSQRTAPSMSSLDDLMADMSSYRKISTDFDVDDYYNGPSDGSTFFNTLSSTATGALTGSAAGPWGALAGGVVGLGSGLIGGLLGKNKARQAAEDAVAKLKKEANETNNYRQAAYQTMAQSMTAKNNRNLFSQIAAYGGPLGISLLPVGGAIDYMQNGELLASLGENMTKNNNERASMPKFAFGGALGGYGGDWSNGLNYEAGKIYDVSEDEIKRLKQQGYEFEHV